MSSTTDGMPVQQGAVVGAVAFVAGLVLTFIIGMAGLSQGLALLVAFSPLLGTISGFLFVHLWPVVMGGGGAGSLLVWTIVPIVVLVVSGYYVANSSDGSSSGFVAGASVTVGYFVLTVLGFVLLLAMGGGGSQGAGVGVQIGQLIVGIIFTGILFPVVFGGIGGAIADSV